MSKSDHNQPTKAEVQTTKLNQMPVPGKFETEFSAEEAAEVFEQQPNADQHAENEQ
ncbi:hypothetical protein JCM10914A_51820 [Paenibacillus sp. JCM 10914]|uniref:hypothetical protein n=1 Tax=Paenibacillus sp. JCM 10914 TaxID=1236974 RepID=UPI0003CC9308|nr:hypothetical protein [Paenibacillus sp. JCM 10914]GAE05122.1 hypothetical protein JCM10914_1210 [Paenibacillus sp. JCM 10914]